MINSFHGEKEYSIALKLKGVSINPPFAYTNREDWFDHLLSVDIPSVTKAILKLRETPKRSTHYKYISGHLYNRIMDMTHM